MTTRMPAEHILQHDCTAWRTSSQQVANLYARGVKLWTKADLRDIEKQLAAHVTQRLFTVRSIDGTTLAIINPMFEEELPIWYMKSVRFMFVANLASGSPGPNSENIGD